ncbi:MAG: 2-C-methyl-D-erythritol 4-phosphate cytidylyltransferase [Bacillota bacterium]|nr:2-C-methyl-D-erythritol 4-phosphate cytidylyltransferase [Bacillota bacterium]
MYKNNFVSAIITAAGSGKRMGASLPKLEIKIKDKALIDYTVEKFFSLQIFDEIILLTSQGLLDTYRERFKKYENLKVVLGGASREESTYLGLKDLSLISDLVVCHDGARPFVAKKTILDSLDSALAYGSGIAAVKAKDTIKLADNNKVIKDLDRSKLYQIQTPQTFKSQLIKNAYDQGFGKIKATDDSSFLENIGKDVYLVEGTYENIKITTKEDLVFGKMLMEVL